MDMTRTEYVFLGLISTVLAAIVMHHAMHAVGAKQLPVAEPEPEAPKAPVVELTRFNQASPKWGFAPPLPTTPNKVRQPILVPADNETIPVYAKEA